MANEKRLIDASALIERTKKRLKNEMIIGWLCSILDECPTVDAVEVVRCKDCKHWQPIHEHIPHMECQIFCGAYEHGYPTNADDFCSYGERRTDERKAD